MKQIAIYLSKIIKMSEDAASDTCWIVIKSNTNINREIAWNDPECMEPDTIRTQEERLKYIEDIIADAIGMNTRIKDGKPFVNEWVVKLNTEESFGGRINELNMVRADEVKKFSDEDMALLRSAIRKLKFR